MTRVISVKKSGLQISPSESKFLERFAKEPLDFRDSPLFHKKMRKFSDPVPHIKPDIGWFNMIMSLPSLGTKIPEQASQIILSREQEQSMFLLYNWYRFSLRDLQKKWLRTKKPKMSQSLIGQVLKLRRQSLAIENRIVSFNLGLIIAAATKFKKNMLGEDAAEVWADAAESITRSIRKFNPCLGYKFSTYFFNNALRNMARFKIRRDTVKRREASYMLVNDEERQRERQSVLRQAAKNNVSFLTAAISRENIDELIRLLNGEGRSLPADKALTVDEREVLMMRFGFRHGTGSDKLTSYQIIAEELGHKNGRPYCYSKERIRQLLDSGIAKLRDHVEPPQECSEPEQVEDQLEPELEEAA